MYCSYRGDANYFLTAILRILCALTDNPQVSIREVIDTPQKSDDVISICDKLFTSLQYAERNAQGMLDQLQQMKRQFKINPPHNTRLYSGVILFLERKGGIISWKQQSR